MTRKIPPIEGEPEGWHLRETTETGYPLMGSSPAERAEADKRAARIKAQAMRGHQFVGEGPYCQHWSELGSRNTGEGRLAFRAQCGYGRDAHPAASPPEACSDGNE